VWWKDGAIAALLAVGAALLRLWPLDPPSLWLDDSWPALVVKADTVHEVLLAGAWAPGFVILLKGWLSALGFSELNAELLPFILGVAAPPVAYVILVRRGLVRIASAAGAFVLLTSSVHIDYSARVKQYTLDALCTLAILAAAWWLLENVADRRRWWATSALAIGAIMLSSLSFVVTVSSLALAWTILYRERRAELRVALGPTVAVGVFALAWWWLALHPRVTPAVQSQFKARFFGIHDGPFGALADFGGAAAVVARGAVELPNATEAFVLVAAAALVLWKRTTLGVLFLAPLALASILAALKLAPLGTGRTDIYLYSGLALLIGVAVHESLALAPRTTVAVVTLLGAASLAAFRPADYPQEAVRPLVRELEAERTGSDAVIVYPKSRFAYALYTSAPVDLVENSASQQGFEPRVHEPGVFLLGDRGVGSIRHALPGLADRYESIWVLVSHGTLPSALRKGLQARGFGRISVRRAPGASLTRWTRAP
jgi:hypothetical protein